MSQEALQVANVVPLVKRIRLRCEVFGTEKWDCKLLDIISPMGRLY